MTGDSPASVTDEAPSRSTGAAIGWWGVRTMAEHEFRLRLRAGRWRWLLAAWFVTLLLLTWGLRAALVATGAAERGVDMFGGLMLFMLALAMLVVPALTAQSINGDRERGVLATLQTTLLTPAEIAIGKLVAAWATTLVFLAVSLPLIVWCLVEGGVSVGRVIGTLIATALLLGALAAIAQCLSAVFARSTTSAVMSYLVVFALSIGTLIAFFIGLMLTTETETVTERIPVWDNGQPSSTRRPVSRSTSIAGRRPSTRHRSSRRRRSGGCWRRTRSRSLPTRRAEPSNGSEPDSTHCRRFVKACGPLATPTRAGVASPARKRPSGHMVWRSTC